jgi:hypothetical protein
VKGKPRGRPFAPGNSYAYKRGENGAERMKARVEIAVDILRQGRDEPEVRDIVERVSAAIADPLDRARKIAQELSPWCVETIAGAVAADSRRLIAFVGPVRVRVDAALQLLKVAGISAALDMRDDVSERFRNVIAAWFGPDGAPTRRPRPRCPCRPTPRSPRDAAGIETGPPRTTRAGAEG